MQNPIGDFGLFLLAFGDHLFTLLAGCVATVLIGIIEKRLLKRPISLKIEVGVLAAFVFFACFQAWRDQYKIAQKIKEGPTVQVNVPQQAPPQVNVNVPAPTISIPHDGAYITISDPSINSDQYRIGVHLPVSPTIKNLSPTAVAIGVKGLTGILIADSSPNDAHQSLVFQKDEETAWNKFMGLYSQQQKDMPAVNYGPSQSQFFTVWTPETIDSAMDAAFRGGTKTIIILSRLEWSDDRGSHTNDYCAWMQNMPGLFIGPGQIGGHMMETFHQCMRHNGLVIRKAGGV
jgi:hypothetical protein